MSTNPPAAEVTVIIPTRNRRRFVERAVADALRQQDVDLEVVVVDDASTDPDAVSGLEDLDPRVRVEHHERQRGAAAARNTGIAAARGRWLAFLDDDDRWAPSKLRIQLDVAAQRDAAWVYGGALTIDHEGGVVMAGMPPGRPDMKAAGNPVPGGCSNVIARADLLEAVGGFDEQLALLADWDLWIRLADHAGPACCPEILVAYRQHPENMHVRDADALDLEFRRLAVKHALPAKPADLLIWEAWAQRRGGHRLSAARLYFRRWLRTRHLRDLGRAGGSLLGEGAFELLHRRTAKEQPEPPAWLDDEANTGQPG